MYNVNSKVLPWSSSFHRSVWRRFLISGQVSHRLAFFSRRDAEWQKGSRTLRNAPGVCGGDVVPACPPIRSCPLRQVCEQNHCLTEGPRARTSWKLGCNCLDSDNTKQQLEGGRCCIEPILTTNRMSAAAIFYLKECDFKLLRPSVYAGFFLFFFLLLQRK